MLISKTEPNYLCWNLDASRNRQFFDRNLSLANPLAARISKSAGALGAVQESGSSVLRFGGTGNDYLTYEVGGKSCPPWTLYTECMNMTWWENTLVFTRASNAKIIVGLSLNTGHDMTDTVGHAMTDTVGHDMTDTVGHAMTDTVGHDPFPQVWDSKNAKDLLEWSINEGYGDLIYGFELGNEQNTEYTGDVIAENFGILYNLTVELWPSENSRPVLLGPDPHSFKETGVDQSLIAYLEAFMKDIKPKSNYNHYPNNSALP